MSEGKLGFGFMRLTVFNGEPTNIDFDQLNQMVDEFIGNGFTYFDTSFAYHNGTSEAALKRTVVDRYPRDRFTIATKFPTFAVQTKDQVEGIFAQQLANLGTDHVDYYLLHILNTKFYNGPDGKGGVVKTCRLFEHAQQWKAEGKIKHLGFSFHSSAKLLDRILTEHPEVEFVQIPFNYIDAESELVQAMEAYQVIRKHEKLAVFMEPVKGGGLSMVPAAVEKRLKEMNPDASIASWAIRYAGSFDGVICNLSGMSTLEQVLDNINSVQNLEPLTGDEMTQLHEIVKIYKDAGPIGADLEKYRGLSYHGAPVTAILEAYNMCQLQPDPGFADDNNYLKNTVAEEAHLDFFGELPEEKVILADGTDVTETVRKAERWLIEHSF